MLSRQAIPVRVDGKLTIRHRQPPLLHERFPRLVDPSVPCAEFSRQDLTDARLIREDLDDWPVFGAADLMQTGPDGDRTAGPGSIVLSGLHHIWPPLASWVRALHGDGDLGHEEL
ncbi:hypothetical protein [Streptomyces sp. NPDC056669]|uniref:hypothetical protein n=1 Tax=Streptomyces sp. NPDC056669 TaxID=3345903 RepID=UPI00368D3CA1